MIRRSGSQKKKSYSITGGRTGAQGRWEGHLINVITRDWEKGRRVRMYLIESSTSLTFHKYPPPHLPIVLFSVPTHLLIDVSDVLSNGSLAEATDGGWERAGVGHGLRVSIFSP